MRLSTKMVLVFSILSAALVLLNTLLSIQNDTRAILASENESLTAIVEKIASEVEQNITIMEYGIDEMLQSSSFMSALYTIDVLGEAGDATTEYQKALVTLSTALYQEPLNDCFHSVNVITKSGLLLSNHFQKFEMAESYSDELSQQLSQLPWLNDNDFSLTVKQIIPPHAEPWNISSAKSPQVYSVVVSAIHRGRQVAYMEVNNPVEDLEEIFSAPELTGFRAAAVFNDRPEGMLREFYRADGDTVRYSDAVPGEITLCSNDHGSTYYVAAAYVNRLHMTVYAAQPTSAFSATLAQVTSRYIRLGLIMLVASISLIYFISRGLTKSMRLLAVKMQHTTSAVLLHKDASAKQFPIVKVTKPGDREAKELEDTFDELLVSLRKSTRNEIQLREATLRARLNALQAQINPHFIYNTLNIISAKSMEHGDFEVIDICDRFAQMLRYSTDLKDKTAPLQAELENARNYLILAKARLEDKLTYEINVPDDMLQLILPRLSLQPIVENAVSHGYRRSNGSIHVQISSEINDRGILCLRIRDNGAGFEESVLTALQQSFAGIEAGETPPESGEHIGLVNTYRRLYYFSQGNIRMRIRNDNGAVIELLVRELKKED